MVLSRNTKGLIQIHDPVMAMVGILNLKCTVSDQNPENVKASETRKYHIMSLP
jgi:hypothetical protein